MSAVRSLTAVMRMLTVLILLVALPAPVERATLEMELFAPVRKWLATRKIVAVIYSMGLDVAR